MAPTFALGHESHSDQLSDQTFHSHRFPFGRKPLIGHETYPTAQLACLTLIHSKLFSNNLRERQEACAGSGEEYVGRRDLSSSSITESDQETTSYWEYSSNVVAGSIDKTVDICTDVRPDRATLRWCFVNEPEEATDRIASWLAGISASKELCGVAVGHGGEHSLDPTAISAANLHAGTPYESRQPAGNPNPRPSRPRRDAGESDSGSDAAGAENPKQDAELNPRFACPFFKRNPQKYMSNRTCTGPGWTSVRRVK